MTITNIEGDKIAFRECSTDQLKAMMKSVDERKSKLEDERHVLPKKPENYNEWSLLNEEIDRLKKKSIQIYVHLKKRRQTQIVFHTPAEQLTIR